MPPKKVIGWTANMLGLLGLKQHHVAFNARKHLLLASTANSSQPRNHLILHILESRHNMGLISVLSILSAYLILTHAKCYFPGGKIADSDVPCNSGPGPSACCSDDATCLANGACLNGGRLSRGSCTDINWSSKACFGYCHDCI